MTETTNHREDLSIDQRLALRTAALRLTDEFAEVYGPETIERFLHSSYDQFAARSTVPNFLPLLAERFARQRLTALARVEGHRDDGRPVVLFLCVHNAGRSQMALGFFTHLAGDNAIAWSGGSEPGDEVNRAADVVVTMGCGDACPIFPGTRYENWDLSDPARRTVEDVRPIRDEIERRVRHLLGQLEVSVSA